MSGDRSNFMGRLSGEERREGGGHWHDLHGPPSIALAQSFPQIFRAVE